MSQRQLASKYWTTTLAYYVEKHINTDDKNRNWTVKFTWEFEGRHDTQHNGIRHNDTKHSDIQPNDIQHNNK